MPKKVKKDVRPILSLEEKLRQKLDLLEDELDQQEEIVYAAEQKISQVVKELDEIEARLAELDRKGKRS